MFFACNSAAGYSKHHRELKEALEHLTTIYAAREHSTDSMLMSQLLKVLDVVAEHFQVEAEEETGLGENDARFREMMNYIMANLHGEINLTELADSMYVSTSTLSRIFKKTTGYYFADYVMQLRVKEAMSYLEGTEESLVQVALMAGFSGSSAFNRAFRKVAGMTPTEYRVMKKGEGKADSYAEEQSIKDELMESGRTEEDGTARKLVLMDLRTIRPVQLEKKWSLAINVGELADLSRTDILSHTLYLQEHLHYSYVRLWNVFSRKMMLTDGMSRGRYNYGNVDRILDTLVENKLRPFLDFGRRITTAVGQSGESVYYEDHYIPFASGALWEEAVEDFFRHIRRKYGREEASGWIFELSRESLHGEEGTRLYAGDDFDFFEAWRFMYRTVKKELPGARFGGVSATPQTDHAFLSRFYQRCMEEKCPPDFCSLVLFPHSNILQWENGELKGSLAADGSERLPLAILRRSMEFAGLPKETKVFITEWNNTIINRSFLNDSCFRAAYLASRIPVLMDEADLFAVMTASDWVSYYYDTQGLASGSIGLLTRDTIRKPAFYALEFLNRLGEDLISRGDHHIATRSRSGSLYVLCFHYLPLPEALRGRPEAMAEAADAEKEFLEEGCLALTLRFSHPGERGIWWIKKRSLRIGTGNLLSEWERFGYSENMNADDIRYLQERCIPEISMERCIVGDADELTAEVYLTPQEIALLHIYRED